jgi:NAD(P)-dependent dehydrogenase (short-subunit alcohol dehydrogenase family)
MLLRDRTVIVTGGASGLGGATVDAIAEAGGRAVIVDINVEAGLAKQAALGDAARFVQADVTSDADGVRVIREATSAFGRIDGLVNAAGIPAAERVLGKEGGAAAGALCPRRHREPHRHVQYDPAGRREHGRQPARRRR